MPPYVLAITNKVPSHVCLESLKLLANGWSVKSEIHFWSGMHLFFLFFSSDELWQILALSSLNLEMQGIKKNIYLIFTQNFHFYRSQGFMS